MKDSPNSQTQLSNITRQSLREQQESFFQKPLHGYITESQTFRGGVVMATDVSNAQMPADSAHTTACCYNVCRTPVTFRPSRTHIQNKNKKIPSMLYAVIWSTVLCMTLFTSLMNWRAYQSCYVPFQRTWRRDSISLVRVHEGFRNQVSKW